MATLKIQLEGYPATLKTIKSLCGDCKHYAFCGLLPGIIDLVHRTAYDGIWIRECDLFLRREEM